MLDELNAHCKFSTFAMSAVYRCWFWVLWTFGNHLYNSQTLGVTSPHIVRVSQKSCRSVQCVGHTYSLSHVFLFGVTLEIHMHNYPRVISCSQPCLSQSSSATANIDIAKHIRNLNVIRHLLLTFSYLRSRWTYICKNIQMLYPVANAAYLRT